MQGRALTREGARVGCTRAVLREEKTCMNHLPGWIVWHALQPAPLPMCSGAWDVWMAPPALLKPCKLWTGKQVVTAVLMHYTRDQLPFTLCADSKVRWRRALHRA